jgi:aromatic ring-opening dioxygenase catalytic subunit (LigB family)
MVEAKKQKLTPVHYFSHGTPTMLGEESPSADYWKECGAQALRHGIKHVIIMVCEFTTTRGSHAVLDLAD